MIYSNKKPAIYEKCKERFGVEWDKGIIITFGDTVYCKFPLLPDKEAHEMVHVQQQSKMDKDLWWDKYLNDPTFRLSQEVEAYQAEADFVKKHVKDRNQIFYLIDQMRDDLSSSIYGFICTYQEAKKLIK